MDDNIFQMFWSLAFTSLLNGYGWTLSLSLSLSNNNNNHKPKKQNAFMGSYFTGAGECYFDNDGNQFTVDDLLLDFPNDEDVVMNDTFYETSSASNDFSSSNSSVSGNDAPLSSKPTSYGELCVPYDDLAELEWLSSFTEESFSSDDLHNLQIISAASKTSATDTTSSDTTPVFQQKNNHAGGGASRIINNINKSPIFQNDVLVPGKVRSKRSRAAPCDWSSRLLLLKSSTSATDIINQPKTTPLKKTDCGSENSVRRCLHCGSDKTPQWRRGPMGPKTLCNACGVRFKSGRLMPEYRPAASPSFVPSKHSNSHRKVMELRRQMELRNSQQQLVDHSSSFDVCNGGSDDYLIHRQIGPNYLHMI